MARFEEPDDERLAVWREWVAERPPEVRAAAEKIDPWTLYRMTSTGQRVRVLAVSEPEKPGAPCTCRVLVSGEWNFVTMERQVYGVAIDDLVECDLPGPHEPLGVMHVSVVEMSGRDPFEGMTLEVVEADEGG